MIICKKDGCGVCNNCSKELTLKNGHWDICRYDAEKGLDLLHELLDTTLTKEQVSVIDDFSYRK